MLADTSADHGPGLVGAFLSTLAGLPDASGAVVPWTPAALATPADAHSPEPPPVPIAVCLGGSAFMVLAEIRRIVFPIDVHKALWTFGATGWDVRRGPRPFLLAEAIAPDARRLLRDERIGYYDRGGSLFLPHPDPTAALLIDRPPPRLAEAPADAGAVFAGRAAEVLRTLLAHPGAGFRVNRLAREAGVSIATASQTLSALERRGWLETRGRERFLTDPAALLAAWGRQPSARAKPARSTPVHPQPTLPLLPPSSTTLAGVRSSRPASASRARYHAKRVSPWPRVAATWAPSTTSTRAPRGARSA